MQFVKFVVRTSVLSRQSIWMTGDCLQLGDWSFSGRIPLNNEGCGDGIWSCLVGCEAGRTIRYRYLICEELDGRNGTVLTAWEAGMPRVLQLSEDPGVSEVTRDDGVIFDVEELGCGENATIDKGLLTEQSEIHLRFHSALSYPIKLWTTGKEGSNKDQTPPPPPITTVKVLSGSDCQFVYEQPPCGVSLGCQQDNMLVFSTQTLHKERPTFIIQLFSNEISDPLGVSWVVTEQMSASSGVLTIPVLNSFSAAAEPIGSLSVDFLKITPFHHINMDLSCPYRSYWNCHQKPLDIGHRGMGMSLTPDKFNKAAAIPENTIHSFLSACDCGAEYIEFDVQLSRDKVLVIFHDLFVSVSVLNTGSGESVKKPVLVKEFTAEQLTKLKINPNPFSAKGVASKDLQFFPTLEEVFQRVPEHIGFYIDIKYTETNLENDESDFPYFGRNEYADLILNSIFCHAKSRPIVMASFDPDMCTLLHLKQPQYPVLFLTCGINDLWPVYRDIRQRTFGSALAFAKSEQLLGISAFSTPLLADLSLVKWIVDSGLILFTWGEDNNDAGNIAKLKEARVHAVCYDRISELKMPK